MNIHKKVISLLSLSALCLTPLNSQAYFTDIGLADPHYTAIGYLKETGVFKGYQDGSFGRDKIINRAEALKVILASAEISTKTGLNSKFADVPKGIWFHDVVTTGAAEGIVSGDGNGTNFVPGRTVNKAEFMKMLMKAFAIDPNSDAFTLTKTASDLPDNAWFTPYMKFALQFNIMRTDANNNTQPARELTRAGAAQLIFNTMHKGQGLSPQDLLNIGERHLATAYDELNKETPDLKVAAVLVALAKNYLNYADERVADSDTTNQNIVYSAQKISNATEDLIKSLVHLTTSVSPAGQTAKYDFDEVIAATKRSWAFAQEARELNPKSEASALKIQDLSKNIADKAREAKSSQ